MQTRLNYMKNAIINTVAEITEESLMEYIYSMVMAALIKEKRPEVD